MNEIFNNLLSWLPEQIDILLSKNQVLCDLIYNVLYNYIN